MYFSLAVADKDNDIIRREEEGIHRIALFNAYGNTYYGVSNS